MKVPQLLKWIPTVQYYKLKWCTVYIHAIWNWTSGFIFIAYLQWFSLDQRKYAYLIPEDRTTNKGVAPALSYGAQAPSI